MLVIHLGMVCLERNLGQGGYWFFHSAGNLALYSSAGYLSYRSWTQANTFTVDEFHHLVITYTPATSTTGTYNTLL